MKERTTGIIREAYYTDRIDFQTVESMLGTEEAMRTKLLRDSLDRSPPEPQVEDTDPPTQADFYSDAVPEWTLDEDEGFHARENITSNSQQ